MDLGRTELHPPDQLTLRRKSFSPGRGEFPSLESHTAVGRARLGPQGPGSPVSSAHGTSSDPPRTPLPALLVTVICLQVISIPPDRTPPGQTARSCGPSDRHPYIMPCFWVFLGVVVITNSNLRQDLLSRPSVMPQASIAFTSVTRGQGPLPHARYVCSPRRQPRAFQLRHTALPARFPPRYSPGTLRPLQETHGT